LAELGTQFANEIQTAAPDWNQYLAWLKANGGASAVPEQPMAESWSPETGATLEPAGPSQATLPLPEDTGGKLATTIADPTYGLGTGDWLKYREQVKQGGVPDREGPIRPLPTPAELAKGTQPIVPPDDGRPSWQASARAPSEVSRDAQVSALRMQGVPQDVAEEGGGASSVATEMLPGTGTALAGADTAFRLGRGEYGQAAAAALGVAPVGKAVGKVAGKGIKAVGKKLAGGADEGLEVLEAARKRMATPQPGARAADEIVSPATPDLGAPAAPMPPSSLKEAVQEVTPKGRRQAITSLQSLRDKTLPEAIEIAKREEHLIPQPSGGFSGAPRNVRNRADIDTMRSDFDNAVALGAGVGGDQWYKIGREIIQELAPGNPQKQSELARLLGLTSAQANPDTNMGFAMLAHNAYEMGRPAPLVRTTSQANKYIKSRETGTPIKLGPKTYIYGENLDPSKPWTTTGTNDIWHARAFGFTSPNGKPWEAALAPQNHAFLDAETVLAVDRANAMKLGGRDNWTAPEIQAAAWVGRKAQGLVEKAPKGKPMSIGQGLAEATVGYTDAAPKYTAKGTYELTPGQGTRHLPGVAFGDEATRAAYAQDPRMQWTRDIEGKPYDTLYQSQGALERPTQNTMGLYENPQGIKEQNPGYAARPMVSLKGGTGQREWHPDSLEMIRGVEALRGYGNVQNMAAASQSFPTNQPGRRSSLELPTTGPLTPQMVQQLQDIGAKYDLPHLVDQGDMSVLTNWGGRKAVTPKQETALQAEVGKLGIDPNRTRRTELKSTSIDYSGDFAQPDGTGAATKTLFDNVSDHMAARFDADPNVRAKFSAIATAQRDWAARSNSPIRDDVMNALDILGKEGPGGGVLGLKQAWKAGAVSLPAIAALAAMPEIQQLLGGSLGISLGQASQPPGT